MNHLPAYLTVLFLAPFAAAHASSKVWHPIESGCHEHSVNESLTSWRDAPHSPSSLRLAVAPDTGRGPAVVVALDKGLHRALGANGEPILIAAVGDMRLTCVHRMPLSACEPAQRTNRELASMQVPLSHDFDAEFSIRLHATEYHLQWRDGSANANSVSYLDPDHPVSAAVTKAIGDLEACWSPAMAAWQHAR
jgi:hypothetical protein